MVEYASRLPSIPVDLTPQNLVGYRGIRLPTEWEWAAQGPDCSEGVSPYGVLDMIERISHCCRARRRLVWELRRSEKHLSNDLPPPIQTRHRHSRWSRLPANGHGGACPAGEGAGVDGDSAAQAGKAVEGVVSDE